MSKTEQDRIKQQRRVIEISGAILKHAAELRELASELDGMVCQCNAILGDSHGEACPVRIAWEARSMADGPVGMEAPLVMPGKSVRHLAAPFRADETGGV